MRIGELARRAGHESGDSCADSIEVYQRKLAEVDVCLDQLNTVRASLQAKLAEALARQDSGCQRSVASPYRDRSRRRRIPRTCRPVPQADR
jgi:hypothetical protein